MEQAGKSGHAGTYDDRYGRRAPRDLRYLALYLLFCCLAGLAHSQQASLQQPSGPVESTGAISGTVIDQTGNAIVSAKVTLTRAGQTGKQETVSGSDGHYGFTGVAPGPFQITVNAEGFSTQISHGTVQAGATFNVPEISLPVADAVTEVRVGAGKTELAQEQLDVEEKQRVLGFIPNFYVTYDHNAVSLSAKQKFQLAWKSSVDPVTFAFTGVFAGVEQAENTPNGFGQGAQGYAKRYGAFYADGFIGTMIGSAILPSVLKQDPRYFYKGTGSARSRIFYALANSVICKGDNGRWQPNYSGIMGSLAAGAFSNLYYPAQDRDGAELTFENAGLNIAFSGVANLFQEFVVRKFTRHPPPVQAGGP